MIYKLTHSLYILRISDGAYIPDDLKNTDYKNYLAWVAAGNTPEPADPIPPADYSALRKAAYVAESDPIFFMWQRGEATQQQWLDKLAEIKARWPN